MADITVTIPADEALFALAALDRHAAEAFASARKMRNLGTPEGTFELDVADTTAAKSERVRRRIADALFPPIDPAQMTWDEMRRQDAADEAELGLL